MARVVERLEFDDADDVQDLLNGLEYEPRPTKEEERELLASLPEGDPDDPIMVVQSVRLPVTLAQRIRAAADDEGMTVSEFIRNGLTSIMAGRDRSNLVSLDDVIRAVKALPHAA